MKIIEKYKLSQTQIDRIVEMGWEDRTPFDAIKAQFGLSEAEVIEVMKQQMHPRNWRNWRARVHGRATKHAAKLEAIFDESGDAVRRHRSRMQRGVGNRISKRF